MSAPSKIVQGMDAAATLICDGEVVAAVSQERFDRVKKSGAFPFAAMDYCLNAAGLKPEHLDAICGNFSYGRLQSMYQLSDRTSSNSGAYQYWESCLAPAALQDKITGHYGAQVAFEPMDHHDCHLHSHLASAPFDNCLAIVMDAAGETGSTSIYHVTPGEQRRLHRYPINQSLGMFYSLITQYLGFQFNEDEYKIMGLAALGDAKRYAAYFEDAIRLLPNGGIEIPALTANQGFVDSLFCLSSSRVIEQGLGFDGKACSMEQRADVSAALQHRFTQALFHVCAYYKNETGATNLLMSGGCAENCSAIGEVRKSQMFDQIHIAFASGDEGTAFGAAAAYSYRNGQPVRIPGQMPFYGPAPDLKVVHELASRYPVTVHEFLDEAAMLKAAADDVADDKIIAICHGRMEYGARALGNRSLLANPANGANKDRVNEKIKKRQNYRPFAPAVLLEDAHRYFDLHVGEAYPYMTMLTDVRPTMRAKLPAITHIDGTARVQTVERQHNPAFYELLWYLKRRTDMGVVLNTSYNVNHQPIVCSEQEGIETFLEMGIDALYMANARIVRA